jgi:hypothetical protein
VTRALIMAGGADEKWTARGGQGRRHLQVVCGERVIDRMIRQLRERGVTDIGVIAPLDIPDYDIPGTFRVRPTDTAHTHEGLNGRHHWHEQRRTIMVYGDTVFSDSAMDRIVGYERRSFQMFGRFGNLMRGRVIIKGGGGELFAFSFWPEHRDAWEAAVRLSFELKERSMIKRGGSWEAYRIMGGARGRVVGRHRLYPKVFTNINDGLTDDFDTPEQFARLKALYESIDTRAA